MKILWVSLRIFENKEETQSAVWLKALAIKLSEMDEIELGNISCKSGISEIISCDYNKIRQWVLPTESIKNSGYPSKLTKNRFSYIIDQFKPDIIQVWGSENPLRLLPFDDQIRGIKVLTMQGVLSSIAPVILSGMTNLELLSTIGIREIIKWRNLFFEKKSFKRAGLIESEMIYKSDYIITQSDWTDSQVRYLNPNAKFYRTHRVLREAFLESKKWGLFKHNRPIIYSAAVGYSLKGLHILIKSLAIVKMKYPDIELRLAGAIGRTDFLGEGYLRFILRLIKNLDLEKNVIWLGAIPASEIVKNLQESSVFVNPSFVESYSLSLAEAMSVGTPSVVSFAGAMPELAEPNKEALFFSPGDYKNCASLISLLLSDNELSNRISENAISRADERNFKHDTVSEQIKIYKDIINSSTRIE